MPSWQPRGSDIVHCARINRRKCEPHIDGSGCESQSFLILVDFRVQNVFFQRDMQHAASMQLWEQRQTCARWCHSFHYMHEYTSLLTYMPIDHWWNWLNILQARNSLLIFNVQHVYLTLVEYSIRFCLEFKAKRFHNLSIALCGGDNGIEDDPSRLMHFMDANCPSHCEGMETVKSIVVLPRMKHENESMERFSK